MGIDPAKLATRLGSRVLDCLRLVDDGLAKAHLFKQVDVAHRSAVGRYDNVGLFDSLEEVSVLAPVLSVVNQNL